MTHACVCAQAEAPIGRRDTVAMLAQQRQVASHTQTQDTQTHTLTAHSKHTRTRSHGDADSRRTAPSPDVDPEPELEPYVKSSGVYAADDASAMPSKVPSNMMYDTASFFR